MTRHQVERDGLVFSVFRDGTSGGEPVVLLHGFPDIPSTFHHQTAALAAAGYEVLSPALRGYEPSSVPPDRNVSVAEIARDLIAVIDDFNCKRVHLIGHDWGAVVGYAFAAMFPERVASLATIAAPPPLRAIALLRRFPAQLRNSWYMLFFQLPGAPLRAIARDDWALIRTLWRDWSPGYAMSTEEWRERRDWFERAGVKRAMIDYYRQNFPLSVVLGLRKTEALRYRTIAAPTLSITGADDRCIDTRLFDDAFVDDDFPGGWRVERIDGAGHFVHLEASDTVNALLLNWLARH